MNSRRSQSRAMSLVEATLNVLVGFWVAVGLQLVLYPAFGIRTAFGTDLAIAAIFTLVSIVRSYCMRRLFERLHNGSA